MLAHARGSSGGGGGGDDTAAAAAADMFRFWALGLETAVLGRDNAEVTRGRWGMTRCGTSPIGQLDLKLVDG